MELHTPTTLLLIVMVSTALAVALGLTAWRQPRELALCAGAMALHALAFALPSQRGQLGGLWTVVVAGLALSAGLALVAEGIYRFQRRAAALAGALEGVETPTLPGAAGAAARVSLGEDETGPQAAAFAALAATHGLVHCHGQALPASDRQCLGTLLLIDRGAPAPADDLARLAALAIERSVDARRLRESERQYRELIESANEGICVLQGGLVRYVNPKVREMAGYTEAELLGRRFLDFVHAADRTLVERNHHRRLQGGTENLRYPVRLLTRDQGTRWFEISGVPLEWQGRPATLNFLTDITERKQEDDLLHELAYHDALTGLANRRLLLDHLDLTLAGNRRHGRHGALLFIDLDNFKPLNDRHGHHVGDLLLVEVARRPRHCVRELDTVARFGGDEFVVLLSGLAGEADNARQQAAQVAEKARRALAEP